MGIDAVFDATRAGLEHERLRLDVASRNIAGANTPISPAAMAASAGATGTADFAGMVGEPGAANVAPATRSVHDPSHPLADADGQVHYPDVDLVQEMTTLMTASRGYEANVRAFNLLRGMVLRALEIGGK